MGLVSKAKALLGISGYQPDPIMPEPSHETEMAVRGALGGNLAPPPVTQTRWLISDLERAQKLADVGDITLAARLWRASQTDGKVMGALSTRAAGLVRLPKVFRGNPRIIRQLEYGHEYVRSIFDEMFPPSELSKLASDGIGLGVGVAELVPVPGRPFPVMVRLDPEFLFWLRTDGCWYYRSVAGNIPIRPGDGRWILHMPGGRVSPWQTGIWRAVGRAFICKEQALLFDQNWMGKLANPARVAQAPQGSTETAREGFFRRVMAWGVNTVIEMLPGWEVKLLESNGTGSEAFNRAIARADEEIIVAINGQTVTTDGGSGFQNSDIHRAIRADLIKATADDLAFTINTQGIPQYVLQNFGPDALYNSAYVSWDVTPPRDRTAEATAFVQVADATVRLTDALSRHGLQLDALEFATRYNVPLKVDPEGDILEIPVTVDESGLDVATVQGFVAIAEGAGVRPTQESVRRMLGTVGLEGELIPSDMPKAVRLNLAPTDVAKAVRISEVRASEGLPPLGDDRDNQMLSDVGKPPAVSLDAEPGESEAQT